eukprot:11648273-Prorocentrum_lima.AAC.1
MTSSLVGSEMCIRDSRFSHLPTLETFVSWAPTDANASSGAAQAPEASTPVSYTHLTLPTICSV